MKLAAILASLVLAVPAGDPLTRPIAADYAAKWLKPHPPLRLHGEVYLVGFLGLNVGLVRTDAGLILIDGAVPQAAGAVAANIRALGFDPKDIRLILSTEPHWDHAGGLAALARDSGATVVASAPAAEALRRGASGPEDPQYGELESFPPVTRLRAVEEGERIRLGRTTVTARAMPGHTPGSMGWSIRSCEGKGCVDILFSASLSQPAAKGYRFSDHPDTIAAFRRSFATLRALPCDILISSHPDQSGNDSRIAAAAVSRAPDPFIDPASCRNYADKYERLLDEKLANERSLDR